MVRSRGKLCFPLDYSNSVLQSKGQIVERVCFQLKVKQSKIDEYKSRHSEVWPEMLLALSETGWHNYSLFLSEEGLLIGYFETPDLDAALKGMSQLEVNSRWQAEMAEFFENIEGKEPDKAFTKLEQVFNLEGQLSRNGHL